MNLQAQRDLSIAGDVVGRDRITINLTRGLDELSTRYDSRVRNFLEYYVGAKDHPAPFGGRASDLAALDGWLNDSEAPPYASLIAPAGRGKSALLAHWVTRLASRPATGAEAVHVVYFPISIRFNTNLETVVFASLAGRMAHVYGEKVTQAVDAQQYRGVFSDYLRRTPPNGGRVLVVLDGLDEAASWEAGADLFPTVAPGHLRVIVAARPLALDKDETAWLNRLGWEMPNRAQRLSLAGLDREGVRDVLSQMGNPLDALATKIDLISRLYELSAGDPLLVRLYVEALLPQGAQAATLTPDDLAKLQPGLEAYFKRWFEEQQKLWGAAKPLHDKTVRGLLNLCAAALGPLKKDDVLALAPDIFEDSGLLDEAAAAVNRFIIGDGLASGYVFSHPRLGEYFAAKLTDRERQAWQARFLQYGRDTLTALENKTLLPKNAPAYVVQYYGAHLVQAKASATNFYALVCESWLRAWEWLEGTPAGFLNDADRAWQKAEAERPAALGQQIRAALCFASVTSLSANIPKDLLVACVKAGVISPALGLVMARQKPDPKDRAECLAAIAEFQSSESHAIMSEALTVARTISEEGPRVHVLVALAPRLQKREQASVLDEALLSATRAIHDPEYRAHVLGKVAPLLPDREQTDALREALSTARGISYPYPEEYRSRVFLELVPCLSENLLNEALSAARAISDEGSRARVLVALAPRLPEREQADVFAEALSVARVISNEVPRASVLGELAQQLPEREQAEVIKEALSAAHAISDERSRTSVLVALAPWLPEHEQVKVLKEALLAAHWISFEEFRTDFGEALAVRLPDSMLGEALSVARAISDEMFRFYIIEKLAPRLSKNLLGEALSAVHAISDEAPRACVLGKLASRLTEPEQTEVFGETMSLVNMISNLRSLTHVLMELVPWFPERMFRDVLSAVRAISNIKYRARVMGELAPRLPEHEQADVFAEALAAAEVIYDQSDRADVLKALALRLPKSMLGEALAAARAISDEHYLPRVLEALVSRLPESMLGEALTMARTISDEWSRARVLGELSLRLPKREQAEVLEEALSAARAIYNEESRSRVLGKLASRLLQHEQPKVLREALTAARAISDERFRPRVLGKLAQQLPEHEQAEVFDEALSAVRAIHQEEVRINVLGELAPRLPESMLGEALQMTRTLYHYNGSITALSSLATRWSAVCRSTQRPEFEELSATLRAFARTRRPQLLQAIQALLPVIAEQGGVPALRETARAIVDTANWWP